MGTTSNRPGLSIGERLSDPDGYSLSDRLTFTGFHVNPTGDYLLLQTGDYLLLQTNGRLELEAA